MADPVLVLMQRAAQGFAYLVNPVLAKVLFGRRRLGDESELDARLDQLTETMQRSSALVTEVEAALEVRKAAVAKLKDEAETAQRVTALNREERDAVAELLRGAVAQEGKKAFWLGAAVNLIFFIAGILFTLWLGK